MRVSEDTKKRIKMAIQKIVANDPAISLRDLQTTLREKNINIGNLNTLSALRKELLDEGVNVAHHETLSARVAEIRDQYYILYKEASKIAFWEKFREIEMEIPTPSERISALNLMAKLIRDQFKMELETGFIKTNDQEREEREDKEQNKEKHEEMEKQQVTAITNWIRQFGVYSLGEEIGDILSKRSKIPKKEEC